MSQVGIRESGHGLAVATLSQSPLDLLIVGGGIVGSGIARDAALRGLRVGLVERRDFAWGTSSRSTRLLHGGIRYLAQAHLGLVRQASLEKAVVGRIAPHLAAPLPFLFPTYRGTAWPKWKLRVGVRLYDLLCNGRNFGASSALSMAQLHERVPGLRRDHGTGAVRYYDGATDDARLVLDTLRSAARHGATLCNYVSLDDAVRDGDCWRCRLTDHERQGQHEVAARCIVNATGPWADRFTQSRVRIRASKGIHLVLDGDRLPLEEALMMTEGRRVIVAVPWGERLYVGTTDTDYDGSLDDVQSDEQDVKYLLDLVNHYFPQAAIGRSDVHCTWAGVRPLIADGRGTPSDVSRNHEIIDGPDGWIDVAGGKLTTYRLIAQQSVDRVLRHLGTSARACRTAEEPLLDDSETQGVSGIVPPPVSADVAHHACANEWALHLDDVMVRRTRWHYYVKDRAAVARQVASWMADRLGWDDARREQEIERYDAQHRAGPCRPDSA
ncbi:MAG: glycerol-3-phosphate oxidase [Phycisphaeraceae bacterium]|nr:glycerol-3-phosphate oxidase [Phycisphaeraceae bacterium]